jgi:hypothetical protein
MALLAVQDASAGLANVNRVAANAGGDTIGPGMRAAGWSTGIFLVAQNTDVATRTVTVDGVAHIVPATTGLAIIPVNGVYPERPKSITYSAVTNLTVAAVQIAGR